MPRLLLCELRLTRAQVNLREGRDDVAGVGVVADLEENPIGVLEVLDRLVGLPQLEIESAEVVQELADVRLVGQLLVLRLGALRIRAGEHPVPGALGDERSLEIAVGDPTAPLSSLGELERALDVLPRGFPVALAPVAAGAPAEGVGAETVGREPGALGKIERLAEECDR